MFNIYYGDSSSNLTLVDTGAVTDYTDPNNNYRIRLYNREGAGNRGLAYTDLVEQVNNKNLFPVLSNPTIWKNRIRWNGNSLVMFLEHLIYFNFN